MGKGGGASSSSQSMQLSAFPRVHQQESSLNPGPWVFMEASLHSHDSLNHWPLVIDLNLQPLSPPRRSEE